MIWHGRNWNVLPWRNLESKKEEKKNKKNNNKRKRRGAWRGGVAVPYGNWESDATPHPLHVAFHVRLLRLSQSQRRQRQTQMRKTMGGSGTQLPQLNDDAEVRAQPLLHSLSFSFHPLPWRLLPMIPSPFPSTTSTPRYASAHDVHWFASDDFMHIFSWIVFSAIPVHVLLIADHGYTRFVCVLYCFWWGWMNRFCYLGVWMVLRTISISFYTIMIHGCGVVSLS